MHQGIMSHQLSGHSCFNGVFNHFIGYYVKISPNMDSCGREITILLFLAWSETMKLEIATV